MVDFPNGTPALPDIDSNDPPGIAAGGLGLRTLINRSNDNILALINEFYQNPINKLNPIINGGPVIFPDANSLTAIGGNIYLAEGWRYIKAGTVIHDASRSVDVPAVSTAFPKIPYSLKLDVTTADAAVAAGDVVAWEYLLEGYLWSILAQRQFTIRFWVKSTKTGIHCVAFTNSGSDRTYVAEYTVNISNTWEEKSIIVPASPSAGTWDYLNGVGIRIRFCLMAGSTVQVAPGAWATGNFYGSVNQVNDCDNTANDFFICGLTAQPGPYSGPYIQRGFGLEEFFCRRYYQKTYDEGTAPGTNTIQGLQGLGFFGSGGANAYIGFGFSPPMRAIPTITFYGKTGTAGQFYNPQSGVDSNNVSAGMISSKGMWVQNATTGTEIVFVHYVANARMA